MNRRRTLLFLALTFAVALTSGCIPGGLGVNWLNMRSISTKVDSNGKVENTFLVIAPLTCESEEGNKDVFKLGNSLRELRDRVGSDTVDYTHKMTAEYLGYEILYKFADLSEIDTQIENIVETILLASADETEEDVNSILSVEEFNHLILFYLNRDSGKFFSVAVTEEVKDKSWNVTVKFNPVMMIVWPEQPIVWPYEKPVCSIDEITYKLTVPGRITSFHTDPEMPDFVQVHKTSPNEVVWEFQDIWTTLDRIGGEAEEEPTTSLGPTEELEPETEPIDGFEKSTPECWEDLNFTLSVSSKTPMSVSDVLIKIVVPILSGIIALSGVIIGIVLQRKKAR